MKLIKFTTLLIILLLSFTNAFADTKKDCSAMKADTGFKMVKKLKCKMDSGAKNESFGKKLKNIFKKKTKQ